MLLSILEELPMGVWVARAPSGDLVYANRAFAEIMGMHARDDVRAGLVNRRMYGKRGWIDSADALHNSPARVDS